MIPSLLALFAASAAPPCTVENSETVTIPALQASPRRYLHRCVAVSGLLRGNALFTSIDAIYLAGFSISGNPAEHPELRQRVILHGGRQGLRRAPRDERYLATIFGRFTDCSAVHEAARARERPGEWIMVTGFCHYMSHPYLEVDGLRLGPLQPLYRLMGEPNHIRFGDLTLVPDDWPHRRLVEAQAARYLAALQSGDRGAFLSLHLDVDRPGHGREAVRLAFGRHPGFAALRASRGTPATAIFRWGGPGSQTRVMGPRPPNEYGAIVCFCREADCAGRWPISEVDADNAPARPYVCTSLGPYVLEGGRTVPAFSTERAYSGLPEPRRNGSTR